MITRVDVAPEVLYWAVERAGWDVETAVKREPKFPEWVSGETRPTVKQLEKFANKTHTPFGFLFLSEPPVETVPIPDLRTVGSKGIRRPSADLLDTIYLCQNRQDWYRDYALANGIEPLEFVGAATIDSPAAQVAAQMRELLDFGLEDSSRSADRQSVLRALVDSVERAGVLVMINGVVGDNTHRKLDCDEFRGFALCDPLVPLVFVNATDTKAAQIFTLIHELAHIWLGRSALSEAALDFRSEKAEELWCNSVAAEVLLPIDSLRDEGLQGVSSEELDRLASKYKVSTLVVLKRIFDLGILKWDEYVETYRNESARTKRLANGSSRDTSGGNYYHTVPFRLSRSFARAVISSAFEGTTLYRDAYRLLGTKKHSTFEKLADAVGVA